MKLIKSRLFNDEKPIGINGKEYLPLITVNENQKGVLDVDTVKGCTLGMKVRPSGGCYNECYAAKIAKRYGIDFSVSVSRKLTTFNRVDVFMAVKEFYASWYRIGTAGDPCHDWNNTLDVCEYLHATGKQVVIITKHWIKLSDEHLSRLSKLNAVINTSISALDTKQELKYRLKQIARIKIAGIKSVPRVVTCNFGITKWSEGRNEIQSHLLSLEHAIDNPLRAPKTNVHVLNGDILLTIKEDAIGGGKSISLHNQNVYLGACNKCPDQCGATPNIKQSNKQGIKNENARFAF